MFRTVLPALILSSVPALAPLAGEFDPLQQVKDPHANEAISTVWKQEWRYAMLEEALRRRGITMEGRSWPTP